MSRIPRLPPESWQIALPTEAPLGGKRGTYDDACAQLKDWGFRCVREQASVNPSYRWKSTYKEEQPADKFSLWLHPAGMIMALNTYKGWSPKAALSMANLLVQQDTGYMDSPHQVTVHPGQSGGSSCLDSLDDGAFSAQMSTSLHERITLWGALSEIQERAPVLPFERWRPKHLLYLSDAFWVDFQAHPEWVGGKDETKLTEEGQTAVHAAIASFLDQFEGTDAEREALYHAVTRRPWVVERHTTPSDPFHYVPVEEALNYVRRVAVAANHRFPDVAEREQVSRWTALLHPQAPEHIDPADWGPVKLAQMGVSLPGMLAWNLYTPGVWKDAADVQHDHPQHNAMRLWHLLREAPESYVRQWCTEPDATGFTLPMHLLAAAGSIRTQSTFHCDSNTPPGAYDRLLQVLIDRVGAETLVLSTEQASLPGFFLEEAIHRGRYTSLTACQARFHVVHETLRAYGRDALAVPLRAHLPVLNPETGDEEEALIALPTLWSAADLRKAWQGKGQLADRYEDFLRRREAQELDQAMTQVAPTPETGGRRRARM